MMKSHTFESFSAQLAMLLRDEPVGSTADLADGVLAYWNGHTVIGIYLSTDESDDIERLDEEYTLDENMWAQYHDQFGTWLANPRFTVRPELRGWLNDAPPYDAGV